MANVKITGLPAASTPLAGTELFEVVQSGSSAKVAASAIANTFNGTLGVANGGTGATTLTGYVKGAGTAALTASATIPAADITGTLGVDHGGTGAATLTGYVKGNGTSAMTASATIPFADITGRAYLSAYDTSDQTGNIAAATPVKFGTTAFNAGITVENDGSGNVSRITYAAAGTYMLAPSIQLSNSDASDHDVTFWFRKNGSNIANSATFVTVPKAGDGGNAFFQIVLYEQVTAGQYIEMMWLPENAAVTLNAIAAGAIAPAVPSTIIVSERIA